MTDAQDEWTHAIKCQPFTFHHRQWWSSQTGSDRSKLTERERDSSGCWPLGVAGGVASWREVSVCQETDCYPPTQTCESEHRRERERERQGERDKQRSCVLHRRCVVNQGEREGERERERH